jgi:hypothetical protein
MMTTSIREAIRERLDPVIEEIVAREISERGSYYTQRPPFMGTQQQQQQQPFGALAPILLSALMGQQQPGVVGQQQPFGALTSVLLSVLMGQQQQQPGILGHQQQQQNPLWAIAPILLSHLVQQQQPGVVGQQQSFGALAPILLAALSAR